jgi:hypothetical protein
MNMIAAVIMSLFIHLLTPLRISCAVNSIFSDNFTIKLEVQIETIKIHTGTNTYFGENSTIFTIYRQN